MSEFEDAKTWNDFFNSDQLVVSHLKNYEFLEKIGQGGMGAVYKARQLHPHRLVAIKISKAVSTSSVRRFEREMQIALQLEHPGIAKIYDAGVQNNQQYLVMDYVEGQPLDKYFATASTEQKLNVMIEVCSILDYAHRQNIIHRDLKPANIMITNNGKPIVIDFGLAKNIQTRNFDLTKTGEVLGTPNYMAPEQIAGKSSNIDHRVDIYALGAIIYEIICDGKMITSTNSLEALFQIQQANFISPLKINSKAKKNLVNIWRKATASKKEHRYKRVLDLKNDLCKVIQGDKVKGFGNKRVFTTTIIIAIFAVSFLYYISQQKSTNVELSAHQKEQQRKNEAKLQQTMRRIENRKLPKNFDIKDFNDLQRMDLVKALYNEGFYQRASEMLETISSSNTTTLYYRGLIFYEQNQYVQAQKVFNTLLQKESENHKYHKLAHMYLNNSWHSQKFTDIDRKDCLSMLRREKKVFLEYLLIEGHFHMFGVEPIIEIAKSSEANIITRMLCCVVLRKNYLAENIEVFYSWPEHQHKLSKDEREFLQVNISQAMYIPHFIHRIDTFQRPSRKENKMVPEEEVLLWHLARQSNARFSSVAAALSLHALLPTDVDSPELDKIIFKAMDSDDIILSSYAHSLFWMSPNAKKSKYFLQYKKSLQSKHLLIQEIVLSQIEIFRDCFFLKRKVAKRDNA